jgi:hypothetical protein
MSAHINMSERGHGVKQDKKRATTAIFSTFLADLLPVQKKKFFATLTDGAEERAKHAVGELKNSH